METAWNCKHPTSGHFHCWLVSDLSRKMGRARSPVGLLHQTEAGKAENSFKNGTIWPEIQKVALVFFFFFVQDFKTKKLAENQLGETCWAGGAGS